MICRPLMHSWYLMHQGHRPRRGNNILLNIGCTPGLLPDVLNYNPQLPLWEQQRWGNLGLLLLQQYLEKEALPSCWNQLWWPMHEFGQVGWGFIQTELVRRTLQLCSNDPGSMDSLKLSMIGFIEPTWNSQPVWPSLWDIPFSILWIPVISKSPAPWIYHTIWCCHQPPPSRRRRRLRICHSFWDPSLSNHGDVSSAKYSKISCWSTQLTPWKCSFYCVGRKLLCYFFHWQMPIYDTCWPCLPFEVVFRKMGCMGPIRPGSWVYRRETQLFLLPRYQVPQANLHLCGIKAEDKVFFIIKFPKLICISLILI